MTSPTLNPTVLEPLFVPWAEPTAHRVRAEKSGDPAVVKQGRRASPIDLVNNLRSAVRLIFPGGPNDKLGADVSSGGM